MKFVKPYLYFASLLAFSLTGCLSSSVGYSAPERKVARIAQKYLQRNGYLENIAKSSSVPEVELGLWDEIRYKENGVINWRKLLSEREGTFSDKLFGVLPIKNDFLVYYRMDDEEFSCVTVALNPPSARLNEANCKVNRRVVRIEQSRLVCE